VALLDWAPARAAGDWNRVLELATKRGLDRTLVERNSDDLALLADAAHYLRRDDVAERALLAQRQRFAGSTRAKDAAFLLGRIVESKPDGALRALDWYDRHLEEAPEGTYASEALGRKMTVLAQLRGDEAARPVAEEYLRRYPSGTYARAARAYAK
jgi:TolA-binding protein